MSAAGVSPRVVDASVVVKWVVEEEFADQAEALFTRAARSRQLLQAPALLPNEVTNAVYQKLRRGRMTTEEADRAVAEALAMIEIGVELTATPSLLRTAYAFAKAQNLPAIYDSLYVVLARDLDAELWTDDRRLLAAVSAAAPWVRWIGDYPTL